MLLLTLQVLSNLLQCLQTSMLRPVQHNSALWQLYVLTPVTRELLVESCMHAWTAWVQVRCVCSWVDMQGTVGGIQDTALLCAHVV